MFVFILKLGIGIYRVEVIGNLGNGFDLMYFMLFMIRWKWLFKFIIVVV